MKVSCKEKDLALKAFHCNPMSAPATKQSTHLKLMGISNSMFMALAVNIV